MFWTFLGEVLQLQLDLQNQERTRDSLTQELTKLISSNQEMSQRLSQLETLQNQFGDLQTKYNALLQVSICLELFYVAICLVIYHIGSFYINSRF